MAEVIQRVDFPELFFGIVAPIGTDIDESINHLKSKLEGFGYGQR